MREEIGYRDAWDSKNYDNVNKLQPKSHICMKSYREQGRL